jgi:hypothetical protein
VTICCCLWVTDMSIQPSAVYRSTLPQKRETMTPLAVRVHGEYREMPGLRLTVRQAARLFNVAPDVADAVLDELRRASLLVRSADGAFAVPR